MEIITEALGTWCNSAVSGTWHWFNTLNREEWMVVLAVGSALGFLCMRGLRAGR
ncbi:hypothetical protein [Aeoliella mucimassa]|uniref:Uncharacterized protein n=1 Tax=Aeoliella mucimassa TaxID=2527972 RepID=A0A518ANH1_9BACT|nr:hypothetical protein [Aeoliella mucimassa]QDU56269.1 hypothetical protein Pan181_24770 [Aeoliella mucimassa]